MLLSWDKLTAAEQERLSRYYRHQVFPVLTPLRRGSAHPFPDISAVPSTSPCWWRTRLPASPLRSREDYGSLNRLVPVDDMTDDDATNDALRLHHHGEPDHRAYGIPVPGHDHQSAILPALP